MLRIRVGVPIGLAAAALAAVWMIGRHVNPGPLGFRLDDAWILLVYGQGLASDGFLSYVPGVPSTGCTSPLWAAVIALVHVLLGEGASTDAILIAEMAIGVLLHLATAGYAGLLVGRISGHDLTGAIGGGLVALAIPLAATAFSGMEVTLTGLLLLVGVGAATQGRWTGSGIALALAALSRPESAMVSILVAAFAVADAGAAKEAIPRLVRLSIPSAVGAGLFIGYDLWASGAPLPATFYAKESTDLLDLPRRWGVALRYMLSRVPPLGSGIAWLALLGFLPLRQSDGAPGAPRRRLALLPLAAGLVYLTTNLYLIDPIQPFAFYHQRYLMPALPLLLVGLTLGAQRVASALPMRWSKAPLALLAFMSILQAGMSVTRESVHLHNDIRNINEVQRNLGEWLGAHLPEGTWIAASDAGAIRYFSGLPTIDVLGLNTPEMLAHDEAFVRQHPVAMAAIMPAWVRPVDPSQVVTIRAATTEDYSVTSSPIMATQFIIRANPTLSPAEDGSASVRVGFDGIRSFELELMRNPLEIK